MHCTVLCLVAFLAFSLAVGAGGNGIFNLALGNVSDIVAIAMVCVVAELIVLLCHFGIC
jgi:hypothetical protein